MFYYLVSAENQSLLVCNSPTDVHASVIIPFLDNGGIIAGAVVGGVGGIVLIAIVIITATALVC